MIQVMPEATEETAIRLTEIVESAPPITDMIENGMTAEDIAFYITQGFDMLLDNNTAEPKYECKCSRARMEKALISIGKKELREIIDEQGSAEMTCRFCDNVYKFTKEELEELYNSAV